ncbi:hypothetical protein FF38_13701 [Lucilia cuprina]|uniref:Uncharacterized protein n=1 Tax=Lucilia cuprina TaxID=7375 RepID=A0A0L0BY97_LUCCU|nr:hypothetical protein FF38_13701 [Lucilia cuprina]
MINELNKPEREISEYREKQFKHVKVAAWIVDCLKTMLVLFANVTDAAAVVATFMYHLNANCSMITALRNKNYRNCSIVVYTLNEKSVSYTAAQCHEHFFPPSSSSIPSELVTTSHDYQCQHLVEEKSKLMLATLLFLLHLSRMIAILCVIFRPSSFENIICSLFVMSNDSNNCEA